MADAKDWRRAFAIQAKADLTVRDVLCLRPEVEECQQFHYLQMACEKLVKAHLFTQADVPKYVFTRHAVVAKHLPRIVGEYYRRWKRKPLPHAMMRRMKALSREIELLAPAVKDAGRKQQNCEYPWEGPQRIVRCPAMDRCTSINLNRDYEGRLLLQLLPEIVGELCDSD